MQTPLWQAANHEANISGAEARVAHFCEQSPFSYRPSLFYTVLPPDFFSDDHSYDPLLLGQQVLAQYVQPVESPQEWQRQVMILRYLADRALPQQEALPWLTLQRPDLLEAFVQEPES
ncbi:hypothetical protein GS597_13820 [Synechococcales cyanobacterium C]|uniref:Uncharacterized protein n=1 Tax=Petrachloros mirabilis ULC683 TaxID=2781853 RepID=A0A8K2A0W8_9CYAN|nr:hypothetical protein [Petrachloros mirabilis]NCJ07568.1 hypothetical protein [Petrachloros mirabilis ULC683]